MVNPIKSWRRGKESNGTVNNGSVKIISEQGDEVGELWFNFTTKKELE